MSKEQYRVWSPDLGQAEDDCGLIMAYDHSQAAKDFVEGQYRIEPFDTPMDVLVRCTFGGDDGELKRFGVHPEPTVYFAAFEKAPA